MENKRPIATSVGDAMASAGFNIAELAEATGLATETLRRRLEGKPHVKTFDMDELHSIAQALGLRIIDILPMDDLDRISA